FRREVARLLDEIDVILTPSSAAPAAPIDRDDERAVEQLNFDAPWNLIGLPAITFPCGLTDAGLPLAVQAVSRPFAESDVLRLADAYQRRTHWHLQTPPGPQSI